MSCTKAQYFCINPTLRRCNCNHFVKSTSILIEGDLLIITIPEMIYRNHDKICLSLGQEIPEGVTSDTKVEIHIGDAPLAKVPVITRRGNFLYADALLPQIIYPLYMATDTSTFVLYDLCKIKGTQHVFPSVPDLATPAFVRKKKKDEKGDK